MRRTWCLVRVAVQCSVVALVVVPLGPGVPLLVGRRLLSASGAKFHPVPLRHQAKATARTAVANGLETGGQGSAKIGRSPPSNRQSPCSQTGDVVGAGSPTSRLRAITA